MLASKNSGNGTSQTQITQYDNKVYAAADKLQVFIPSAEV